jgi:hypothetical protein
MFPDKPPAQHRHHDEMKDTMTAAILLPPASSPIKISSFPATLGLFAHRTPAPTRC